MQVCSTQKLLPSQYIDIPRDMSCRQFGRLLEKVCQADEGEVIRFWCLSSSSVDVDQYKSEGYDNEPVLLSQHYKYGEHGREAA